MRFAIDDLGRTLNIGANRGADGTSVDSSESFFWGTRRHPPVRRSRGNDVRRSREGNMAARKKKKAARRGKPVELIISKSRTKGAVKKCNVGGEFYGALDQAVRQLIKDAEARAVGNKRKTLKAVDL
jgi:hypothetical protein